MPERITSLWRWTARLAKVHQRWLAQVYGCSAKGSSPKRVKIAWKHGDDSMKLWEHTRYDHYIYIYTWRLSLWTFCCAHGCIRQFPNASNDMLHMHPSPNPGLESCCWCQDWPGQMKPSHSLPSCIFKLASTATCKIVLSQASAFCSSRSVSQVKSELVCVILRLMFFGAPTFWNNSNCASSAGFWKADDDFSLMAEGNERMGLLDNFNVWFSSESRNYWPWATSSASFIEAVLEVVPSPHTPFFVVQFVHTFLFNGVQQSIHACVVLASGPPNGLMVFDVLCR